MALIKNILIKGGIRELEKYVKILEDTGEVIDKSLNKEISKQIARVPWSSLFIVLLNKLIYLFRRK